MASYRRLPNKKWQAEVLLPVRLANGRQRRVTKTHPSKAVVREWATRLEADIDAGTFVDPRAGDVTLADYHARWLRGRIVTEVTAEKVASHWRNHIAPAFGGHPLNAITRDALKRWVRRMDEDPCPRCLQTPGHDRAGRLAKHHTRLGVPCRGAGLEPGLGAHTIQGVVSTLSAILSSAVEEGLIGANPASRLPLPRVDAKPVFYWTKDQAARIVAELYRVGDAHDDQLDVLATMVDLDMHTGLRLGELLGLRRRFVDLDQGLVSVAGVQTRKGWREYPKSRRSRRAVPIPRHLMTPMRLLCDGLDPDDVVFRAPHGGAWDDSNFRRRVFEPAVQAAGVPRGTPHDMRHTAASWLVQAGVDLYRVQALLGHESFMTTQRYAHLAPDHFGAVMKAWEEGGNDEGRTSA